MGPFLFVLYTSSITEGISNIKYADDTSLIFKITKDTHTSEQNIRDTFQSICLKSIAIKLRLNPQKSKLLIIPKRQNTLLNISIPEVANVSQMKLLGVTFTDNLKWNHHISDIVSRCNRRMYTLRMLRPICTQQQLLSIYYNLIRSVLDYACPLFVQLPDNVSAVVNRTIKRCHKIIHSPNCTCNLFESYDSRRHKLAKKLFQAAEDNHNHPLHSLIPVNNTRTGNYLIEFTSTSRRQSTFHIATAIMLNNNIY